jgi:hypothetical protein
VHFFDKYYRVLKLPTGASDSEVKAAYRRLAKKYHPDISRSDATRVDFIRVNEAYEILIKRDDMVREAIQRNRSKNMGRKRKNPVSKNPQERASTHADMKYEEFVKSPLYRTAMVMNSAFDYIFILAGVIMVAAPIFGYVRDTLKVKKPGEEAEFHLLPILLGIGFLYGLWYFLFNSKRIKPDQE